MHSAYVDLYDRAEMMRAVLIHKHAYIEYRRIREQDLGIRI